MSVDGGVDGREQGLDAIRDRALTALREYAHRTSDSRLLDVTAELSEDVLVLVAEREALHQRIQDLEAKDVQSGDGSAVRSGGDA